MVGVSTVSPKLSCSGSNERGRTIGGHVVACCRRAVLPGLAACGAILYGIAVAQDSARSDLRFTDFAFLSVDARSQYLFEYILPPGWLDGRCAAGDYGSFTQL